MVKFLKDTCDIPQGRKFPKLLAHLDSAYPRQASEQAIRRMGTFGTTRKVESGDMQTFWIRFQKPMVDVRGCGLTIANEMKYVRALHALSMAGNNRLAAPADISRSTTPHCPIQLRDVSLRLFNVPPRDDEILHNRQYDSARLGS